MYVDIKFYFSYLYALLCDILFPADEIFILLHVLPSFIELKIKWHAFVWNNLTLLLQYFFVIKIFEKEKYENKILRDK